MPVSLASTSTIPHKLSPQDPAASKPEEWDEQEMIVDPEDVKPAGYDDIPATLSDPEATKPEDWSDEEDGTWEAPTIPNPDFKGDFKAKMIKNPAYKGKWVAPDIANPAYKPDDTLYNFKDSAAVGFELWQVRANAVAGVWLALKFFKVWKPCCLLYLLSSHTSLQLISTCNPKVPGTSFEALGPRHSAR